MRRRELPQRFVRRDWMDLRMRGLQAENVELREHADGLCKQNELRIDECMAKLSCSRFPRPTCRNGKRVGL